MSALEIMSAIMSLFGDLGICCFGKYIHPIRSIPLSKLEHHDFLLFLVAAGLGPINWTVTNETFVTTVVPLFSMVLKPSHYKQMAICQGPNKLEISYAHEYHWHTNSVQKESNK